MHKIVKCMSVFLVASMLLAGAGCSKSEETTATKRTKKTEQIDELVTDVSTENEIEITETEKETLDLDSFSGLSKQIIDSADKIYGAKENPHPVFGEDWEGGEDGEYFYLDSSSISSSREFRDKSKYASELFYYKYGALHVTLYNVKEKSTIEDEYKYYKKKADYIDDDRTVRIKGDYEGLTWVQYVKFNGLLMLVIEFEVNRNDDAVTARKNFLSFMDKIGCGDMKDIADDYNDKVQNDPEKKAEYEKKKREEEIKTIDYDTAMAEDDVYTPLPADDFVKILEERGFKVKEEFDDGEKVRYSVKAEAYVGTGFNMYLYFYDDERNAIDYFYKAYIETMIAKEFNGATDRIQKDGSKYIIENDTWHDKPDPNYECYIRADKMVLQIYYHCTDEQKKENYLGNLLSDLEAILKGETPPPAADYDQAAADEFRKKMEKDYMVVTECTPNHPQKIVLDAKEIINSDDNVVHYTYFCFEDEESAINYTNQLYDECVQYCSEVSPESDTWEMGEHNKFYSYTKLGKEDWQMYVIRLDRVVIKAEASSKTVEASDVKSHIKSRLSGNGYWING